jgi:fibro-slime domain-containing protein
MSSEINFFLPNAVNGANITSSADYVNYSDHDREMIFKFAGDDDVWVFVDDQLVLDMGGVHGKVYGEINFSTGKWTIAHNGAKKSEDGGIMTFQSGTGSTWTGNIDIAEGDHKLKIYYLERGSSQSNCAIYFNIAPKYALRFEKMDSSNKTVKLKAKFGVYTDEACTVAADLYSYYNTSIHTNEFAIDGDNGLKHLGGLVAGRTYYIKELQAPENYPDMSGHVIKLWLDLTRLDRYHELRYRRGGGLPAAGGARGQAGGHRDPCTVPLLGRGRLHHR